MTSLLLGKKSLPLSNPDSFSAAIRGTPLLLAQ
jgi:hypothetical protein